MPYLDLGRNAAVMRAELEDAFAAVLARGRFVGGTAVERFEERWSDWCRAPYAVGVNSGTDAIALALRALGVEAGDEVITAANTCVATVTGIAAAGATAVLADVDPERWTLDPASARAAVTGRTRAVVPVHLYGQCVELKPLRALGLPVVEDAAQAHGTEYRGERRGELAAYSFYPTKNLGALGDAGAVVTSDGELAERLRMLRSHGERAEARGVAVVKGVNSRLDDLQAEILLRKVERLDAWNERRRELAAFYLERLADAGVVLPVEAEGTKHSWHLFVVLVEERDAFRARLRERGVETLVHYPEPIHRQPAYGHLPRVEVPVAERLCERVVSLPLYPELTDAEAEQVVEAVLEA
ncbi:MAG TPA: DegT/DnrJ/EryC1/StrS family aminotransferase [Gaiellaceae bacterium]|nr:DegT/DnrJ/EryC1/StrS family aminotransferase [Gaiellaceae bacterium]